MRLALAAALLALTAASATAPPAGAHTCTGEDYAQSCGPCTEGEEHFHEDTVASRGSCESRKRTPGVEGAAALALLGAAAAVARRAR